jgi:NADPH-dependent 2,4-dienoyl-CoA reductase/sulfur reductase-like enzyme/peroxiredoxin family protein/TusA-related sulfurtransferase/rhodanese-related sulfurtransferase
MAKTVIIGGVAAGAGCAARLRRLDESAEIVLLERGPYISYANCGLPYYVGNVIKSEEALLVTKEETLRERFRVDVRTRNEVTAIDRKQKKILVTDLAANRTYEESYDKLVIATGSSPLRPRIPGMDSERIFTLWTVPDAEKIRRMVTDSRNKRAVVVGGGFIGLETAENLRREGLQVSIVEALDQVMAPFDREMAMLLEENIRENGVNLYLSDGVASFRTEEHTVFVRLSSGKELSADFVILSIGVRPNSQLAVQAGLKCNVRGGICVDEQLRTSDPDIYAAGDVIEVTDPVFGEKTMIPLAGPANRQARILADNIAGGKETYRGTQGASVARIFDLTAASVGAGEKKLIRRGMVRGKDYEKVVISQNSHAGYYPGALPLIIKLLFSTDGKKIFGAQIAGGDGADKRIDTIGTVMQMGGGIAELKNLELAYAPPYSSAKDPVNMAAFAAENVVRKLVSFAEWDDPKPGSGEIILDVREEAERLAWAPEESVNIPLGQLRGRLEELDRKQHYIILCAVGVRAYTAARILLQHGFDHIKVYPGGARLYRSLHPDRPDGSSAVNSGTKSCLDAADKRYSDAGPADKKEGQEDTEPGTKEAQGVPENRQVERLCINCSGLQCPGPIMEVYHAMEKMQDGDILEVTASDPGFAKDIISWCRRTGNMLLSNEKRGTDYIAVLCKGSNTGLAEPVPGSSVPASEDHVIMDTPQGKTIIVFDGDMDKVLAAFVIANGALAMGRPVTMFFTFWGLTALRKPTAPGIRKSPVEAMFGKMLPKGTGKLKLSRMNMGGLGTAMMRRIMQDKNIDSLEDMMKKAMENGVKIIACSMSMDVMGIRKEELIDGVEIGGVGSYLGDAEESNVNLFI